MDTVGVQSWEIHRLRQNRLEEAVDDLAVEEPLEIQVEWGPENARKKQSLSITMRTPGADADLALGFLFTEGIIRNPGDVTYINHVPAFPGSPAENNQILVRLHPDVLFAPAKLERHFYTTSSCGVCGKTSLEALHTVSPLQQTEVRTLKTDIPLLLSLPDKLRAVQDTFQSTGGLHGCAFFHTNGDLIASREDVGRHNALDKLIGHCLKAGNDMRESILLLSGRASFELMQKAAMAGVPVVCAVGAPSSLAASVAADFQMALIGFLREDRFNVYHLPSNIEIIHS
ncbi:MAG: formate dehydrogenase accessory sulfurtransferase FdhD [Bacteroidetes bacterium]|nr:formate dehydrogenase accessory sulfurtransferase FdhD [Bacteroidota bacterium]